MLLLFFYSSFSLISPSVSPSNPNPILSLTPILSSQTPTLTALPCRCQRQHWQSLPCQSLSSNGFFFFFAMVCWVGWAMGGFIRWCVGSKCVGWVQFRRRWVYSNGLGYGFWWIGQRWVGIGLLCWSLKLLWLRVMSVSMTATTRSESGLTAMTMMAMKMVGLEVGVGEGVEAMGLSGFMVEVVVVVGLSIWCWWAMGLFWIVFWVVDEDGGYVVMAVGCCQ